MRRALAITSGALGDAIGKLYVERYFPASARADVQQMAQNIINAFDRARRRAWTWMTPRPRPRRAQGRGTSVGVGYPDTWRNYSTLEVTPRRRRRQLPARAAGRISPSARQARQARSIAANGG